MNSIEMQSRYDIRIRINLCENVERNFLSTKKTRGTVRLKILKNGGIKNVLWFHEIFAKFRALCNVHRIIIGF